MKQATRTLLAAAMAGMLAAQAGLAQAQVAPIQIGYGNVYPTLTEQSLTTGRAAVDAPWYVSFDLLARSDVSAGALGLGAGSNGSFFQLSSMRIVTLDGANVAFGSDSFATNPFPHAIEALATAHDLAPGHYAIEVSGTGNRILCTPFCGDAADFEVRLQVLPGSQPPTAAPVGPPTLLANYGNVFPTLTQRDLTVGLSAGSGPWYVGFNLLAPATVNLGALGLGAGSNGSFFDLSAVRIVGMDGRHVAFGTDTFVGNPFRDPVEALVSVPVLEPGAYAVEFSGAGNRVLCTPFCGDAADLVLRLQVTTAVDEPAAALMLLGGLAGLAWRRRRGRART
ncbi:hypothetical protein BurJ1DRAFT_3579 [Burkholderiales bacterium JOSHI_001]|nr:hypothetical protein BurJ1DRAFT_3579 [Burkholderiales bacterium JOSHI_001]